MTEVLKPGSPLSFENLRELMASELEDAKDGLNSILHAVS